MSEMHLGWHFCAMRDGHPVLRDGTPLKIGHSYEHEGPLQMCKSGFHDSSCVIDALAYASGPYLCRTIASADHTDTDKRVSRYRVALAGFDAEETLHRFAVRIAYCALIREQEHGREPDPRSWKALRVKLAWLEGTATDRDLTAAWDAAWAAAGTAARDATWDAAQAAAWAAARDATWDAAQPAAWAAARDAAWAAAWAASWDTAGDAAWAADEAAAWAAEGAAARAAAWDTAGVFLLDMLPDALVWPHGRPNAAREEG